MVGKRLLLVLAAGALVLLQFTDCMAAVTPDQPSMKCCGVHAMHSDQSSYDCCKRMVSEQSPHMLPAGDVSLHPPTFVLVESLVSFEIARVPSSPSGVVETPQFPALASSSASRANLKNLLHRQPFVFHKTGRQFSAYTRRLPVAGSKCRTALWVMSQPFGPQFGTFCNWLSAAFSALDSTSVSPLLVNTLTCQSGHSFVTTL